jgi:hypothetical protein
MEGHPLDATVFTAQCPRRSATLPRWRHCGWARMALQLRTRAIPSPRHPDPVLVPLTGRAADRLLVSPAKAGGLPSQNGIGLDVGKHFMLPTSTALSYETCLSINAARLVVDEPPRIELRLSQPVGGSRNESASHLRPVRQDQASRHQGEALGALSMDARQLRRLQSDRGRSRSAELEKAGDLRVYQVTG